MQISFKRVYDITVKRNSGQALLIVIITMIVALTAGLSLASRTITNLKLSKQNVNAQRAFQAASAGIEKSLNATSGITNSLSNSSSFTTTVNTLSGTSILLNNGETVDQDRGVDVWLSTYPSYATPYNGTITMYWGSSNQINCSPGSAGNTRAALEVVIISGSTTSPVVSKYAYDRCGRVGGTLTPSSAFGSSFNGVVFDSTATIPAITNGLIMKIIPLYSSTIIGLQGTAAFPSQGKVIQSTGTSGDSARKIIYFESYPQIPNEVFPYAILSQ